MQRSASGKRYTPSQHPSTSYMPLQKKASSSPLEVKLKKPRRWGCCRISIALISLVFFVAFVVTVVYVMLFTDLVGHLTGSGAENESAANFRRNSTAEDIVRPGKHPSLPDPGLVSTTAIPLRELNILVLLVDTRSHIMDNGSYKATQELWRKTESSWRELYESKQMTDRLTVVFCQGCKPVGVKDEDNVPTVFYTVEEEHFRPDTHSYNTVVFVALPTLPGEILAILKRHGRTDTIGEICQKGTWSSTGCDFRVARGKIPGEKKGAYSFGIQVPSMIEQDLLKFNKTVIMQKDIDTFKILINQPMAVR